MDENIFCILYADSTFSSFQQRRAKKDGKDEIGREELKKDEKNEAASGGT